MFWVNVKSCWGYGKRKGWLWGTADIWVSWTMQSEKWGKSRCCGISEEGVQGRYEEVREGFLDVMAELKLEV